MGGYQIIDTDADNVGGCGHCGNKNAGNLGHRRKTAWLKACYGEGLRYKVLRSEECGDIGMIEYAPGSHAWRPVEAEGYLAIHCLWVYGQHKGKGLGSLLLESCLEDARKSKCRGVAVVTSSDSLMAGNDLFDGKLIAHRPISATRFLSVMRRNAESGSVGTEPTERSPKKGATL
ncbi:MAG: GNAT family N-acetyltransferase [Thermoguttaceae bacterium]